MANAFTFDVPGDLAAALAKARQEVTAAGGTFSGDLQAGSFSGKTPLGAVKGTYTAAGRSVTVTITEKPWLVPAGTIEATIREYFGAA
jgi:hypothetical protein